MPAKLTPAAAAKMTAAELVAHLVGLGLSQREIARRISSTSPTISRIANGERTAGELIYRRLFGLATGSRLPSDISPDA